MRRITIGEEWNVPSLLLKLSRFTKVKILRVREETINFFFTFFLINRVLLNGNFIVHVLGDSLQLRVLHGNHCVDLMPEWNDKAISIDPGPLACVIFC